MGRLDVIENYVKTGGVNGGKYTMDRLYQRANSFIRMVTNREEFQHMQSTMKSEKLETDSAFEGETNKIQMNFPLQRVLIFACQCFLDEIVFSKSTS